MSIELRFQSVQIKDIQEYLPNIISAIQSSPVLPKKRKRRKPRKKRITAGQLIDEIISDVEKY